MKRRWIIGLVVLVLVAGATALLASRPIANLVDPAANARRDNRPRFGPDESRPTGQTHVGKTREELISELGEPTREGPWQIGMPSQEVFDKYKGLRTLEWEWESGKFLASVHPVDGLWVCFNSYWVPKGWVLD